MTPNPRELTVEELLACGQLGLEVGVDDDDEDKHQFTHLCWAPAPGENVALCGSERLWRIIGPATEVANAHAPLGFVDCPECFRHLKWHVGKELWPAQNGPVDP